MTIVMLTIPGRVDTNHRPRSTARGGMLRTYKDPAYAKSLERIAWLARGPFLGWPTDRRYEVSIVVHEHDGRRRDLDNFAKPILDGLAGIAWENDRQVDRLSIERGEVRKLAPSVTVIVSLLAYNGGS
jgi:Holliday junction resolvase RusA-like endonuclease